MLVGFAAVVAIRLFHPDALAVHSLVAAAIGALLVVAAVGAGFYHSALVEEQNLTNVSPVAHPVYPARTKMPAPRLL